MTTLHERAATAAMEEALSSEDWAGKFLVLMKNRLNEKYYTGYEPDAIVQLCWRSGYSLTDAYVFAQIWSQTMTGEVAVCCAHVGSCPSADRMVSENQKLLNSGLHEFFAASVESQIGPGAECDGWLRWNHEIEFTRTFADEKSKKPYKCKPETLPLEIGTTKSSRTWMHLFQDGGVARWPYGHDCVTIFKVVPESER
jgi:hypothetical protein